MNVIKNLFFLFLLLLLFSACAEKQLVTTVREEAYQAYSNNDYGTAAEKFELLVKKAPEDVEFWFRLGNAYARSQRPGLAVSAYQNALLGDPKNVKAWYNMGIIQTQTALKTFVDMGRYTDKNSLLSQKGQDMQEGLFLLLEPDNEQQTSK